MRSKHVAKTFKCISTYNCVFYYIIVVSDVKYIQLHVTPTLKLIMAYLTMLSVATVIYHQIKRSINK